MDLLTLKRNCFTHNTLITHKRNYIDVFAFLNPLKKHRVFNQLILLHVIQNLKATGKLCNSLLFFFFSTITLFINK